MPKSLYNPNDNVTGRDGGPYLDEVEARSAEARRAVVEDREPEFDNPGVPAGIPLVSAGRAAAVFGVNNLPSQSHRQDLSMGDMVDARAEGDQEPAFKARGEIPDEFDEISEEAEDEQTQVEGDDSDEDSDSETSSETVESDQSDLNSHDPAAVGVDPTDSDEDEDSSEPTPLPQLGFDSQYEDDASRKE